MTRPTPEELLEAWAHRPADLTDDERRRVEELVARLPAAARQADEARAMIARVAQLPAEGAEPVWSDLERAIRVACDEAPSSRWARFVDAMRGWKPAAGIGAGLVVAMAAFALWIGRGPDGGDEVAAIDQQVDRALAGLEAGGAEGPDEPDDTSDEPGDTVAPDGASLAGWDEIAPTDELLDDIASDLAWIDELDDAELDAVSAWLDAQEPG